MKYYLLKTIVLIFLFSCTGRSPGQYPDTINRRGPDTTDSVKTTTTIAAADSNWLLFSDSSYKLNIHIFNPNAVSDDEINSVVTFSRVKAGKTKNIFQDSFHCTDYYIERQDFNGDHIKDVLIYNYPGGARANPTYHLYLVDKVRHKLTYVKGFEKLLNPGMDSVYNIISSLRLSGRNYYSFYRINSKNKLINLGHGYMERPDDSTQYEQAIRAIITDRQ
ncbi:MAG TPA: hypothetical protein VGH64_11970, partial [Puia sp.]